jgi:hypothetical protein
VGDTKFKGGGGIENCWALKVPSQYSFVLVTEVCLRGGKALGSKVLGCGLCYEWKFILKIRFLPHRKHSVSMTTTKRLMLCRKIASVYCENHTERINTLSGQLVVHMVLCFEGPTVLGVPVNRITSLNMQRVEISSSE